MNLLHMRKGPIDGQGMNKNLRCVLYSYQLMRRNAKNWKKIASNIDSNKNSTIHISIFYKHPIFNVYVQNIKSTQ